jgi:hypothetical protein
MNDRPLSDEAAGFILRWSDMKKKRIIVGYFAASIIAMLASDWALAPPARSAFSFLLWIALGPIGIVGFATLDIANVMWPIKNGLYYLAATAGLAACLWFIQGNSGLHRRIGKVVMVLVWLACSAYVMEFLSWAA